MTASESAHEPQNNLYFSVICQYQIKSSIFAPDYLFGCQMLGYAEVCNLHCNKSFLMAKICFKIHPKKSRKYKYFQTYFKCCRT